MKNIFRLPFFQCIAYYLLQIYAVNKMHVQVQKKKAGRCKTMDKCFIIRPTNVLNQSGTDCIFRSARQLSVRGSAPWTVLTLDHFQIPRKNKSFDSYTVLAGLLINDFGLAFSSSCLQVQAVKGCVFFFLTKNQGQLILGLFSQTRSLNLGLFLFRPGRLFLQQNLATLTATIK